jgi:DNA repair protein RadC
LSNSNVRLQVVRTFIIRDAVGVPDKAGDAAWVATNLRKYFHADVDPQENVWAFYLDSRQNVIACELVYRGTVDTAVCSTRDITRTALLRNAVNVIVAHNHPSGDPMPSPQDQIFTDKLRAALDLFNIELLDHVVVGAQRHCSFRERGWL